MHKPWDYKELKKHDDHIRNLLTQQKKERKEKTKQVKRDYMDHVSRHKNLQNLNPFVNVKAVVIKNGLIESINFNSDLNIRISMGDQVFLYNFKQKGTKDHIFQKLDGNEQIKIEVFDDVNEKIEKIID